MSVSIFVIECEQQLFSLSREGRVTCESLMYQSAQREDDHHHHDDEDDARVPSISPPLSVSADRLAPIDLSVADGRAGSSFRIPDARMETLK